jgi:branched-chain amino acid transport system ATP-binding protein
MLSIKNLNVKYNNIRVVHDVSLNIENGELIALIGANGAGKSTILKTLSGLIRPESGHIFFEGKEITKLPSHEIVEKGIIHVPEGRQIFAKMTIEENLKLGAYQQKDKNLIKEKNGTCFRFIPYSETTNPTTSRHPVRRRTTDAGYREGFAGKPKTPSS